jgi:hypothetical protein
MVELRALVSLFQSQSVVSAVLEKGNRMSIRRTGLLAVVIVLQMPAAASATGHNADISGGFSAASGSWFKGFHETFGKTIPPDRRLSVLADLSIYKGSENDTDQTLIGWMGGAGWTIGLKSGRQALGPKSYNYAITATPRVLAGGFHTNGGSPVFSAGFGGAVDFVLGAHPSSEPGWGVRGAYDYIVRRGDAHNLHRYSVEAVYRFAHQH